METLIDSNTSIKNLKLPVKLWPYPDNYKAERYNRDIHMITERWIKRILKDEPQVGDIVETEDGEMRIAHIWDYDGGRVQMTHSLDSFHLCESGNCSYSGGLEPSVDLNSLRREKDDYGFTRCWVFSGNQWEAHNGTTAEIKVKKWKFINHKT